MGMQIQTTATIRQRKQLTIPDSIADRFEWAQPGSVVTIKSTEDEIVIGHYSESKEIDWDEFWRDIKRVRSYKGKYKGSLSKFIAWDRQTRR